jgi:hypothetical protein
MPGMLGPKARLLSTALLATACATVCGCSEKDDPGKPRVTSGGTTTGVGGGGAEGAAGGSGGATGGGGAGANGSGGSGAGTGGGSGGGYTIGNCDCVTNMYNSASCTTCAAAAMTDSNLCLSYSDACANTAGCEDIVTCLEACPAEDRSCLSACYVDGLSPAEQAAKDYHACLCEACSQDCQTPLMCD